MSDGVHLALMSAAIEHMAGEIVSTPDANRPWNPCLTDRRAAAWMDVKRERLLRRRSIGGEVYWMPTDKGLNWLLQQDCPGVHAICLKVRARLDDMERQATRGTTDEDPHLTSSINPAWGSW